ncbi:hypothetical protein V6N11_050483 [Hibiscus sabdariffa]|uniref:GDT1 family protein n=1 Tax=Hibiscus sabdariffa TaxID=183260 RepID=A0ABR2TAU5_9ROSI
MSTLVQGFSKSLAMTVLSEIGDKTFFAAAILAMRHPRRLVLSGCLAALIVMTILSAVVGWAAPNLLSRKWTHHITTVLFFGFGLWSLWDAFMESGDDEELAEVEAQLDADWKDNTKTVKEGRKDDDELKKKSRPFLTQFFSPILLKAFSITFFGEWGDKSQLATIGLAADEDPFGVVLGGILGQALCTTAAVLGGKSLASQISEKIVALSGGSPDGVLLISKVYMLKFTAVISKSWRMIEHKSYLILMASLEMSRHTEMERNKNNYK